MIKRLRLKFICINMIIVTIMLCVIFGLILHFTSTSMEKASYEMMHSISVQAPPPMPPAKGTPDFRLPYFTIQLGPNGEVQTYGGDFFDLSDQNVVAELIRLSSGQSHGIIKDYGLRYTHITHPEKQIIFADMSSEINTMNQLCRNCLLIGAISFVVFLLISIRLSYWAVKPVESAWEQQYQFVADASHELKTPLSVILSNTQMLCDEGENPEIRQRLTGNILTVSRQMKELVMTLLDSAQVDRGIEKTEFAALNLSETVTNAILPFDSIFYEKELTLTSAIQEDIWARGSQPHLARVVGILLDNAQKYSVPNGQTQVILMAEGKKHCLLSVSNEGEPLSPQDQKNIFKRFYRIDAARERNGSYGLGLSIAENIVKSHKGKIWVESKDSFNTFYIRLPVLTNITLRS